MHRQAAMGDLILPPPKRKCVSVVCHFKFYSMKIKPEELAANGYVQLDSLNHKELIPFVRTYIKKTTVSSTAYVLSNIAAALFILFRIWQGYSIKSFNLGDAFTHFSYGLALAFTLIPIHEYIHVLAYRSQGAKDTSYDANLKKFYFMAIADKFVANQKEFRVIALAPFVVISSLLLILLPFSNDLWDLTILGILLTHTAFCSGDFGLLSYFDFHKSKQVVTYDDKANKISYFLGK